SRIRRSDEAQAAASGSDRHPVEVRHPAVGGAVAQALRLLAGSYFEGGGRQLEAAERGEARRAAAAPARRADGAGGNRGSVRPTAGGRQGEPLRRIEYGR